MQLDQLGPAEAQPQLGRTQQPSELERLRRDCRRQALRIGALLEAVSTLSCGAKALKAENADLRAENSRLRGCRFDEVHVEGAELASVTIPLDVQAASIDPASLAGFVPDRKASNQEAPQKSAGPLFSSAPAVAPRRGTAHATSYRAAS